MEDFDQNELLKHVTEIIEKQHFRINVNKTKLKTPNTRQMMTGIIVNEKPQVVLHKRNELRQALNYIKKFGFEEYVEYKEN